MNVKSDRLCQVIAAWFAGMAALVALVSDVHAQPAGPTSTFNSQLTTNKVRDLDGKGSYA